MSVLVTRVVRLAAAAAALATVPALAGAQSIRNTNVEQSEWTGSRTSNTTLGNTGAQPIYTYGTYAGDAFSIAWAITPEAGMLRYTYTFSGFAGQGSGISHIILGLSENCATNNSAPVSLGCIIDPVMRFGEAAGTPNGGVRTFNGTEPSNPNLAAPLFGVKVDTPNDIDGASGLMFSFLSERIPVWGDFYVKAGQGSAQNAALTFGTNDARLADKTFFVARPDTQSVVPEPASVALLGGGLAALGVVARRRRQG